VSHQYACPVEGCEYQAESAGSVGGHISATTRGEHEGLSSSQYDESDLRVEPVDEGGSSDEGSSVGGSSGGLKFPDPPDDGADGGGGGAPECPQGHGKMFVADDEEPVESGGRRVATLEAGDALCTVCGHCMAADGEEVSLW